MTAVSTHPNLGALPAGAREQYLDYERRANAARARWVSARQQIQTSKQVAREARRAEKRERMNQKGMLKHYNVRIPAHVSHYPSVAEIESLREALRDVQMEVARLGKFDALLPLAKEPERESVPETTTDPAQVAVFKRRARSKYNRALRRYLREQIKRARHALCS